MKSEPCRPPRGDPRQPGQLPDTREAGRRHRGVQEGVRPERVRPASSEGLTRHGRRPGTGAAAPHPQRRVDQEDHPGHGAHRRLADRAGPAGHRGRPALRRQDGRGGQPPGRHSRRRHPSSVPGSREPSQKVAIIVITADRGLAGGYNSDVIRAAERRIRRHQSEGRDVQLIVTGPQRGELLPVPQICHQRLGDRGVGAAHLRGRPAGGGRRHGALRGGRARPDRAGVHPVHLARHRRPSPSGNWSRWRGDPERPGGVRRQPQRRRPGPSRRPAGVARLPATRPTTSSSRNPPRSSTGCCPAGWSPRSWPPCSMPPRRSTRPASGP